jgi:hypothetical protein
MPAKEKCAARGTEKTPPALRATREKQSTLMVSPEQCRTRLSDFLRYAAI